MERKQGGDKERNRKGVGGCELLAFLPPKAKGIPHPHPSQKFGAINSHDMQEQAALADQAGRDVVCGIVAPQVPCPDSFSALLPFNVMGDGNCCLHAISVALWGIQDRVGVLRGALKGMMNSKELFWKLRWANQEKEWDAMDAVS